MLKYILLGFLNYSPMTGYDLKRIIDHSTAHFWHAYHSQIYTTLARMEDEGLLTSETDDSDDKLSRRVYTITPTGQAALAAWQRQPLTSLPHGKNELLVRLFFSADRKTEEVLDELRIQRRLHQQQLELYNHIYLDDYLNEAPPTEQQNVAREMVFWQMTIDFGRAYEQMYLAWLDETINKLTELD